MSYSTLKGVGHHRAGQLARAPHTDAEPTHTQGTQEKGLSPSEDHGRRAAAYHKVKISSLTHVYLELSIRDDIGLPLSHA